ncbi:hypothetical protein CBL_10499 [Carabus blaptoides fortunei]
MSPHTDKRRHICPSKYKEHTTCAHINLHRPPLTTDRQTYIRRPRVIFIDDLFESIYVRSTDLSVPFRPVKSIERYQTYRSLQQAERTQPFANCEILEKPMQPTNCKHINIHRLNKSPMNAIEKCYFECDDMHILTASLWWYPSPNSMANIGRVVTKRNAFNYAIYQCLPQLSYCGQTAALNTLNSPPSKCNGGVVFHEDATTKVKVSSQTLVELLATSVGRVSPLSKDAETPLILKSSGHSKVVHGHRYKSDTVFN